MGRRSFVYGIISVVVIFVLLLSTSITFAVWRKLENTNFAIETRSVCGDGIILGVADTFFRDIVVKVTSGALNVSTKLKLGDGDVTVTLPDGSTETYDFSGELRLNWSNRLAVGAVITVQMTDNNGDGNSVSPTFTVMNCGSTAPSLDAPGPSPTPRYVPPDDRLNADALASAAVYCRAGGIEVWAIDTNGNGHLAFLATWEQINRVGVPVTNTLIASGLGVRLYRLASGEFQINANPRTPIAQLGGGSGDVPGGTVIHVVQRGDNLFRLARRYQTTVAAIAQANNIADPTRISVGQQLIIPTGGTPVSASNDLPATGPEYIFIWNAC